MQSSIELRAQGLPRWLTWLTLPDAFMLGSLLMMMSLLGGGATAYTTAGNQIFWDVMHWLGVSQPTGWNEATGRAVWASMFALSAFAVAKSSNLNVGKFAFIMTPLNLYVFVGFVYQLNKLITGEGQVVWQVMARDFLLFLALIIGYALYSTLISVVRELIETQREFDEAKRELQEAKVMVQEIKAAKANG